MKTAWEMKQSPSLQKFRELYNKHSGIMLAMEKSTENQKNKRVDKLFDSKKLQKLLPGCLSIERKGQVSYGGKQLAKLIKLCKQIEEEEEEKKEKSISNFLVVKESSPHLVEYNCNSLTIKEKLITKKMPKFSANFQIHNTLYIAGGKYGATNALERVLKITFQNSIEK